MANIIDLTNTDTLDFDKGGGLIPAVVQHAASGAVLMLGYMNRDALITTLARRRLVFLSRSRLRLWEKGEASGNFLDLEEIRTDCDRDTLLVRARPSGPVCHLGSASCFGESAVAASKLGSLEVLTKLEAIVGQRIATKPAGSYTASLFAAGRARIAQKLGEEGLEVALAAVGGNDDEVIGEAADLIYHLLVLLQARGLTLEQVLRELAGRQNPAAQPGHAASHDPDGHS